VEISDSALGLALVLVFFVVGFAFSFCFWRYDPLTVTRTLELDIPVEKAIALCVQAMNSTHVRGVEVEDDRYAYWSVSGHTGPSIRSLGTHCSIKLKQSGRGTRLECRCRPRTEFVLTDWGARRAVIESLVYDIEGLARLDSVQLERA
jgi:hypothetical protein